MQSCVTSRLSPTNRNPLAVKLLSTATGTELPNNANRSIGQTDCVGSAGNAPHMAAGVVVYSHVVIVNLRTIISQINSNSNNRY